MKILNVKGVKTINKSQQKSISGGSDGSSRCYNSCMYDLRYQPGSDAEKSRFCLNDCAALA